MTALAIGVVCRTPTDRAQLAKLRAWSSNQPEDAKVAVESLRSVEEAFSWREQAVDTRLLATVGFSANEVVACIPDKRPSEPVLMHDPRNPELPSATFFENRKLVACRDLTQQVRKSLLRMKLRHAISIREARTDAELASYFALRYQVWKEVGYLPDAMKDARLQWEVDYRDRTSIPFVAFSNADNECVGCVRLVRSFGREDARRVALIERLLAQSEGASLLKLFKYPASMQQPFDVLEVFPNFRARFKELLQKNIDVGEIGRVAVAKDYRRLCLAEMIVDTATSFALSSHVSTMFLACLETRRLLYEKCGFRAIEGITSPRFFNIVGESIMMQRSQTGAAHAA